MALYMKKNHSQILRERMPTFTPNSIFLIFTNIINNLKNDCLP